MHIFEMNVNRVSVILLLVLGIANVALAAPLEGAVKERHHRESMDGCKDCHQDVTRPAFRAAMLKDCVECHASNKAKQGFEQVVLKSAAPVEGPARKKRTGNVGMTLPLYYSDTHIGKNPSPMILIPAGKFTMGSDTRLSDEGPKHTVNLRSYWIDKYEVTNLQYQQFIEATGRHSPQHFQNRTFPKGKVDHPVTYVSWHDAKEYCQWAGKRLPTDEEWEKAARGTDGRTFPWGDEFDESRANTPVRWGSLNQEGDTSPVGAFKSGVSPYGLYDMAGNVWEWTDSWYRQYPGNKHGSENYGEKYKTLKGGSWWDCSFYQCGISAPVFNRSFFDPQTKNSSFGFRCAKDEK